MKNDIEQVKKDLEFIRLVHLIDDDLTYTRLYYRKTAGVELNFAKRRHRRIQRLLENQLKKLKAEELPGMDEIEKLIKETQGTDKSMAKWARVIIETEEKNPKPIAIMTNDDCEVAKGFVIRLLPSKDQEG